ncbi:uncharacterized protein LOC127441191 [Myxocyprinus asiaticus]|uniref:uncharacterized protein LOC127441191 n=1 Tax=Myxocyprinus asiaticus TaxID=70543 RepID=UPI00222289DD|nr:uncharacterized protein LOC127441191 [Myxocyprinus asiaticus]
MAKLIIFTIISTAHIFVCWGQDSVEQPSKEMTAKEGEQVALLCNYTSVTTNAYLFWYKQLPNTSPTFILSEFTIGKGTTAPDFKERFSATMDSTLRTVPLTIQNLHVSDSAVYYCALQPTDAVHQNTRFQTAFEGAAVTINCTYESTDPSPTIFWYQQKGNGSPKYMLNTISAYGNKNQEFKDRFNAVLDSSSKSVPLTIQDLHVSDSAVYYCALRPTETKTHSALIQKLCVSIHKLLPKQDRRFFEILQAQAEDRHAIRSFLSQERTPAATLDSHSPLPPPTLLKMGTEDDQEAFLDLFE